LRAGRVRDAPSAVPQPASAWSRGRTEADRITRLSSLRPCLCRCTPGTRPPWPPCAWARARKSSPGTRGTHPPVGHAASSTRCSQCSLPSERFAAVLVPLDDPRTSPQRVHAHGIPLAGQRNPSNEPFNRLRRGSLVQPAGLGLARARGSEPTLEAWPPTATLATAPCGGGDRRTPRGHRRGCRRRDQVPSRSATPGASSTSRAIACRVTKASVSLPPQVS